MPELRSSANISNPIFLCVLNFKLKRLRFSKFLGAFIKILLDDIAETYPLPKTRVLGRGFADYAAVAHRLSGNYCSVSDGVMAAFRKLRIE